MNAAVEEDKGEVRIEAPGQRLKRLREHKGLELAQVANLLHLSVEKLQALEADQYEPLGGSVFIQGYLRNYARLLDIPAQPLLDAFRAVVPRSEQKIELRVPQVKHEVRSSHLVVRLITWVILLGLLTLVVTWWRGYIEWPMTVQQTQEGAVQNSAGGEESATSSVSEPLQPARANLPTLVEQGEREIGLPALQAEGAAANTDGAVQPSSQVELQPVPNEQAAQESPETAAPPATAVSTEAAESSARIPPHEAAGADSSKNPEVAANSPQAVDGGLELSLSGDSWIEIRGSGGAFKILGVLRKGERRRLEGKGPYRMVLGNAAVVEIRLDGEPIDFSRFVRGNVARFELNSDGTLSASQ